MFAEYICCIFTHVKHFAAEVTKGNDIQLLNTATPIVMMESGITIEVSDVQS